MDRLTLYKSLILIKYNEYQVWHSRHLKLVELELQNLLKLDVKASELLSSINYSVLNGGKRLRPLLSIASGAINNTPYELSLRVGCAIELIHCYSLIHDDLPAMDNDDLRRGKPTCHKRYGEAVAILAGDALQSLAFEILSSEQLNLNASVKLNIINLIANHVGINGMAGGQAIDIINSGKFIELDQLRQMHELKTGKLISAAILAGYSCGLQTDARVYNDLAEISLAIGLLFQIIDDILDVTKTSEVLGKTANKDCKQAKATYVSLLGLEDANEYARELYELTKAKLHLIPSSGYLLFLIDNIYNRNK